MSYSENESGYESYSLTESETQNIYAAERLKPLKPMSNLKTNNLKTNNLKTKKKYRKRHDDINNTADDTDNEIQIDVPSVAVESNSTFTAYSSPSIQESFSGAANVSASPSLESSISAFPHHSAPRHSSVSVRGRLHSSGNVLPQVKSGDLMNILKEDSVGSKTIHFTKLQSRPRFSWGITDLDPSVSQTTALANVADHEGNIYVTGKMTNSNGVREEYLMKSNKQGEILWIQPYISGGRRTNDNFNHRKIALTNTHVVVASQIATHRLTVTSFSFNGNLTNEILFENILARDFSLISFRNSAEFILSGEELPGGIVSPLIGSEIGSEPAQPNPTQNVIPLVPLIPNQQVSTSRNRVYILKLVPTIVDRVGTYRIVWKKSQHDGSYAAMAPGTFLNSSGIQGASAGSTGNFALIHQTNLDEYYLLNYSSTGSLLWNFKLIRSIRGNYNAKMIPMFVSGDENSYYVIGYSRLINSQNNDYHSLGTMMLTRVHLETGNLIWTRPLENEVVPNLGVKMWPHAALATVFSEGVEKKSITYFSYFIGNDLMKWGKITSRGEHEYTVALHITGQGIKRNELGNYISADIKGNVNISGTQYSKGITNEVNQILTTDIASGSRMFLLSFRNVFPRTVGILERIEENGVVIVRFNSALPYPHPLKNGYEYFIGPNGTLIEGNESISGTIRPNEIELSYLGTGADKYLIF